MRAIVILMFLSASLQVIGQEWCAAQRNTCAYLGGAQDDRSLLEMLSERELVRAYRGTVALIPVVVHVVWNDPSENVPDVSVLAMIDQLNADFGATNSDIVNVRSVFTPIVGNAAMSFCLASVDPNGNATNGITRTQTTETWFDPDLETNDMKSGPKGIAAWDPDHYLNIWICDITSGAVGGNFTVGYAFLPLAGIPGSAIDGLVLDVTHGLGPGNRTATHEVGHYFGLLHPFNLGSCIDADGLTDTPPSDSPTYSCANSTLMKCGMLTQYENFMDQSSCSIMFTAGQAAEMDQVLLSLRPGLLTGGSCSGGAAPVADLSASTTSILAGQTIDLIDLSSNNPTQWYWDLPGAIPPSSVDQDPTTVLYTQPGCYSITLTASNAFGSDQEARSCYVDVAINTSIPDRSEQAALLRTGDTFTVQWPTHSGPWKMDVHDPSGRVIISRRNLTNAGTFDVTGLPPGIYVIHLSDATDQGVIRFSAH